MDTHLGAVGQLCLQNVGGAVPCHLHHAWAACRWGWGQTYRGEIEKKDIWLDGGMNTWRERGTDREIAGSWDAGIEVRQGIGQEQEHGQGQGLGPVQDVNASSLSH